MDDQHTLRQSESETIRFAPWWAFVGVAQMDGTIDDKERAAFAKALLGWKDRGGKLVQAILFMSDQYMEETAHAFAADKRTIAKGLTDAAAILDAKLPAPDAFEFKLAIMTIALEIGQASGRRFHANLSAEEKGAIITVGKCLGLSRQAIASDLGLKVAN